MKLLKLHIENFISIKKVDLDFRNFKPGVFLISGPTGSGKSTLLDAIHWALYGVTLNQNRNTVHKTIFSDYASANESANVELEFEQDGKEYRVSRSMNDGGYSGIRFYTPDCIYDKVKDANKQIEKILGLTAKQFDQMVMLEQGNFSKFLLTDSKDRAALLRNVFDTQLFQNLELSLKNRTDNLKQEIENINNLELALLHGELLETIRMRVQNAAEHQHNAEKRLEEARRDLNKYQELLPELHTYEADKQLWLEAQRQLEKLGNEKPEVERITQLQQTYKQHRSSYLQYNKCTQINKAIDSAKEQIQQHLGTLLTLSKPQEIQVSSEEIQKNIYNIQTDITNCESYEQLQADIQKLTQSKAANTAELQELQKEEASAIPAADTANDQYNKRLVYESDHATWENARTKIQAKEQELAAIQQEIKNLEPAYVRSLRNHLISLSEPGVCPVCGSDYTESGDTSAVIPFEQFQNLKARETAVLDWLATHPSSAEPQCDISQSSAELSLIAQNARDKVLSIQGQISKLQQFIASDDTLINMREKDLANLKAPEKSRAELQVTLEQLSKDFAEAKAQEEAMREYQEQVTDLKARISQSEQTIYNLEKEATDANISLNEADYAEMLKEIAAITEFSEHQEEYIQKLQKYASEIEKLNAIKEPTPVSDITILECNNRITMYTAKVEEAVANLSDIKNNLENDRKLVDHVQELRDRKATMLPKYKELSYIYTQISGKNSSKLSLENFVLHRQLEWILDTSNKFLATLSNNQFVLIIRWESTGRSQGGLEISILDNTSGKTRPAQTFSGGELFILSLSLSLGLMSSIDALFSGIKLDMLLIDEGFGSLDLDCLSRVLATLQELHSIQTVGIISHVQELIDSIPQGFLVTKGMRGTEVKQFSNGIQ